MTRCIYLFIFLCSGIHLAHAAPDAVYRYPPGILSALRARYTRQSSALLKIRAVEGADRTAMRNETCRRARKLGLIWERDRSDGVADYGYLREIPRLVAFWNAQTGKPIRLPASELLPRFGFRWLPRTMLRQAFSESARLEIASLVAEEERSQNLAKRCLGADSGQAKSHSFSRAIKRALQRNLDAIETTTENLTIPFLDQLYGRKIIAGCSPDLYIGKSDGRKGLGLFTNHALERGEFVGEVAGVLADGEDSDFDDAMDYSWMFRDDLALSIFARSRGNYARFVNHSISPNVAAGRAIIDGFPHLFYVARRSVAKGEELTWNYGDRYWQARGIVPDP